MNLRDEATPGQVPAWMKGEEAAAAERPPSDGAPRRATPRRTPLRSLARLTRWQLGTSWRLLTLSAVGLMAAITLICAVPLYARLTATAGLRQFLTQNSGALNLDGGLSDTAFTAQGAGGSSFTTINSDVNQLVNGLIGPYLAGASRVSIRATNLTLTRYDATVKRNVPTSDSIDLRGLDIGQIAPQIHLTAGALPVATADGLQAVMLDDAARQLGATVGTTVTLRFYSSGNVIDPLLPPPLILDVPVTIVGLIAQPDQADPYWRLNSLTTTGDLEGNSVTYTAIVAQDALVALLTRLEARTDSSGNHPQFGIEMHWQYAINPLAMRADTLNATINSFDTLQAQFSGNLRVPNGYRYVTTSPLYDPDSVLSQYSARLTVTQTPELAMLAGIIAVMLFFVTLLSDVQIERQSETIATMRSRGVSRWQLFVALAAQGLLTLVIGVAGGLALTVPVAVLVARVELPAAFQSAAAVITENVGASLWSVAGYAATAALFVLAALLVAAATAARVDILSLRREAARTTRVSWWQRLNLDVVLAAGAVVAFGLTLFLRDQISGIDPQIDRLLAPIYLAAPVFLVAALLLIFLRLFALVLRLGAALAARGRGATPLLAVAQLARAPRQAQRLALLLIVALTFAIFITSLAASQGQYNADQAAYYVGADFAGPISYIGTSHKYVAAELASQTARYRAIPGVTSASLGYVDIEDPTAAVLGGRIMVFAVDAATYAQTAVWPPTDAPGNILARTMADMVQRRGSPNAPVLALVDQQLWNDYHLSDGATFTLDTNGGGVMYQVAGRVSVIPGTPLGQRGIMVDYPTFSTATASIVTVTTPIAYAWLRTRSDPASLAAVRAALNDPALRLTNGADRRLIQAKLEADPLAQTLRGLAGLAFVVPLMLALAAALVASVTQVRRRLVSFAVLRALGARPRQIAGVLIWEQSVTYAVAVILGIGLGALISVLQVPDLLYAAAAQSQGADITSRNFYVLQEVLPVRVAGSPVALLALLALVVLGMLALGLMTRTVSRPSVSQTLRLNED